MALNRVGDEMADSRGKIEATLALGATTEAAAPFVRRALRSGMITLVDSTKTTGLISFPARWSACCSPAPTRPTPPSACS